MKIIINRYENKKEATTHGPEGPWVVCFMPGSLLLMLSGDDR